LDKIGVSGILPDAGVVGIVGAGVLEEDRDKEGNVTLRLAVPTLVRCARPRACACTALVRDDIGTVDWTVGHVCRLGVAVFVIHLARQ